MPTRVDLDQYEAIVRSYLAGTGDSAGWELLDTLERYRAVGIISQGSPDGHRAKKLLKMIRSRLGKSEEVERTDDVLKRIAAEYQTGLEALAAQVRTGGRIDTGLYSAAALKLFELRMYEARLKDARARS